MSGGAPQGTAAAGPAGQGPVVADRPRCDRCKKRNASTALDEGRGARRLCRRCFVRTRRVVRRAAVTALVVGSVLTLINHGDLLLAGDLAAAHLWKIPLTFAVPYLVTTWGALGAARIPGA